MATMATIQGNCLPRFSKVQALLQSFLKSGEENGASIVVNLDGENVVDLWGGYTDVEKSQPWKEDTISHVFSTTKTVNSLAALMLVDRGLVNINSKVATYWPEFAAQGKEDVELRHIMSHTSGLAGWEDPITLEEIADIPESASRLAKQVPWWSPGSASGYHGRTHGHLISEFIRHANGRTLQQFVEDEITTPLNADFHYGVRDTDWPRVASIILPKSKGILNSGGPFMKKTFGNPISWPSFTNSDADKKAALAGSNNGHTNARSLARILSIISLGGQVDDVRLLSPETIDLIFQVQSDGIDLVTGGHIRMGTGYALNFKDVGWIPQGRICFWGGWGGSIGIMDVDRRLTITYVMNQISDVGLGSDRTKAYVEAIYEAMEQ